MTQPVPPTGEITWQRVMTTVFYSVWVRAYPFALWVWLVGLLCLRFVQLGQ
jgi:hypothetical protein